MGDKTRGGVYPLPFVFLLRIQYREFLQMYIGDERFTKTIDQNGEGTAAFMVAAIAYYGA